MKAYIHLVNNRISCDVNVFIIIDLPKKPSIGEQILLTDEQAKKLNELAVKHDYINYDLDKNFFHAGTIYTIVTKCEDQSIHIEMIPYD